MKVVVTVVTVVVLVVVTLALTFNGRGIVTLEGYEHGVALCGDEYNSVIHQNEAHFWADGFATYVINKGHLNDPQVKELETLARQECSTYTKIKE